MGCSENVPSVENLGCQQTSLFIDQSLATHIGNILNGILVTEHPYQKIGYIDLECLGLVSCML